MRANIARRCMAGVSPLIILLCGAAMAASPRGDERFAGADARIATHRKADVTICVVDATGRPMPGATVHVEQTRHAFLFGCNIFMWDRVPDDERQAAYRQRFAELLNYATLPFYWPSYEPQRGRPEHGRTEAIARWCREHGIARKGHPLAWNYMEPRWLPDDVDEIYTLQIARITDCVSRFDELIGRWDVVNEATHFDRDELLRRAPKHTAMWKQVGQIEFTRQCFLAARKADPNATLLINDYRTDPPYEKLIEQLVDDQGERLYDVIGIQSHMHGGAWPNEKIWDVCERFSRFGVPLHFTEATILSGERVWDNPRDKAWPSTPEGEAYQAHEAARFYTMLFSHPAVEAITWWDFADLGAWKNAPAGFLRADMSPKPVYDVLRKLIKDKWWSRADVTTGADGKARFRGFLGDYRVSISGRDEKTTEIEVSLPKDNVGDWTVRLSAKGG